MRKTTFTQVHKVKAWVRPAALVCSIAFLAALAGFVAAQPDIHKRGFAPKGPVPPQIGLTPGVFNFGAVQGETKPAPQTLTISNVGGTVALNWSISADVAWVSFSINAGNTLGNDTVLVTVDHTALTPGTYNGTITIDSTNATNAPQTIPINLTVYAPLTTGLQGWWKLDDGSGTVAADSSGNNNPGNLQGTPAWSNGIKGGALRLDGNYQYVDVPDSASLDITGDFTLAAWVKTETSNLQRSILEKYTFPGLWPDGFMMRLGADGALTGGVYNGSGGANVVSKAKVLPGRWYHVAITFNAGTGDLKAYVNGGFDRKTTGLQPCHAGNLSLKIGEQGDIPGKPWGGFIDDARVYSRTLSDDELAALAYRPPVAVPDAYATATSTALNVPAPGVLLNDLGSNLSALTGTTPVHGSVTLNADGSFVYTPTNGYTGPDSFTYTISDGRSQSPQTTVSLQVGANNVTLASPNGGESWIAGTVHPIQWTSTGVTNVQLEVSRDLGATWTTIVASTPASTGSYSWFVDGPVSNEVLVRITDTASGDQDVSNTVFTVSGDLFAQDLSAVLQGLNFARLAWGDYDNDGKLDLAICGLNNSSGQPVTKIYHNTGNGQFQDSGITLAGVERGALAWGDYDNDGKLDLLVTGWDGTNNQAILKLYHNNGGGVFALVGGTGLVGVMDSAVAFADFNNDGMQDVVLVGRPDISSNACTSIVYKNNGDGTFTSKATLTGELNSAVAIGDYDNDGDLDLLIGGSDNTLTPYTQLYRNDGNFTFTSVSTTLPNMERCGLAWGDYDGDGKLDLAMVGNTGAGFVTQVFHNDGGGVFHDSGASFPGLTRASVCWGDFDNDGKLDLAICGNDDVFFQNKLRLYRNTGTGFAQLFDRPTAVREGQVAFGDYDNDGRLDLAFIGGIQGSSNGATAIYHNQGNAPNTKPTVPANLQATLNSGDLTLTWNASTDDTTPQAALTYNVRVGLNTLPDKVVSGLSDPVSGFRRVAQAGNAGPNTSITFHNVPSTGTLHCRVQAIDGALAGSAWSSEVVIHQSGNATPVASAESFTAPQDGVLTVATPGVLANDTDADGDALTAVVVTQPTNGVLALASDGSFTYTPTAGFTGSDSFQYKANDGTVDSNIVTVSLVVNAKPSAVADTYSYFTNQTLNVTAPGVLTNDTDPESDALTTALVTGPAHGTLTLNADGSFIYVPNAGFSATDSFTYHAVDAFGGKSANVSVTLNHTVASFNVSGMSFTANQDFVSPPASLSFTLTEDIDPTSITSQSVTLVRAGPDGIIGTPDDVQITPNSVSLSGTKQIVMDLTGATMPNDYYEVRLQSRGNGLTGGNALRFNGTSTFVQTPQWLTGTTTGSTFECLVKPTSTLRHKGCLVLHRASYNDATLEWENLTGLEFFHKIPFDNYAHGQVAGLAAGTWYHVAGTYDGAQIKIYVNGALAGSQNHTGAVNWDLNYLGSFLGGDGYNGGGFAGFLEGDMQEVRIWSVARTQAEIQAHMYGTLLGTESGLAAYYKFNEGNGQIVHDSSPHGKDGTLGATTLAGSDDPAWVASTAPFGGIQNTLGVPLDGEFSGSFNSGDGTPGGDFAARFTVFPLPTAKIEGSWPQTGLAPYAVAFNGAPNSSSPNGAIVGYAWDFGDGSSGTGATPNHTFDPGSYTISLIVTDDHGIHSTPDTVNLTVTGVNPRNILLQSGTFQIDWAAHQASTPAPDSIILTGTIDNGGWPVNFANASLTLKLFGNTLVGPVTLDSSGRASVISGTPNYRISISRNTGAFSIVLNKIDLSGIPGLTNSTSSGTVPLDLKLTFANGGFSFPVSSSGTFNFDFQSILNNHCTGRYNPRTSPPTTGYFLVTSASAAQSGSQEFVTATGGIQAPGGGALVPNNDLEIDLGGAIVPVPLSKLQNSGNIWTYNPRLGTVPGLRALIINNNTHTFSLSLGPLSGTGIPLAAVGAPKTCTVLLRLIVPTSAGPQPDVFFTNLTLQRSSALSKTWTK